MEVRFKLNSYNIMYKKRNVVLVSLMAILLHRLVFGWQNAVDLPLDLKTFCMSIVWSDAAHYCEAALVIVLLGNAVSYMGIKKTYLITTWALYVAWVIWIGIFSMPLFWGALDVLSDLSEGAEVILTLIATLFGALAPLGVLWALEYWRYRIQNKETLGTPAAVAA